MELIWDLVEQQAFTGCQGPPVPSMEDNSNETQIRPRSGNIQVKTERKICLFPG